MFLARTTAIHVVTYFLAGLVGSSLLVYRRAFEQPVIRDYMVPFGWTTALVIGIGILSTPAAAPSSVEGLVYTRVPLWYHAFGLPEMLVQTFIFSVLVWACARNPRGIFSALPPGAGTSVGAVASFAFIGYAIVSVLFALALDANISDPSNLTLRTQGLFIAPFLLNIVMVLVLRRAGPVASRTEIGHKYVKPWRGCGQKLQRARPRSRRKFGQARYFLCARRDLNPRPIDP